MKKCIICLIALVMCISFISCDSVDKDKKYLSYLEESNHLNVFNETITKNTFGSLTLNWVLTDGITTLVKITADDELMKYCSLTNLDNNLPVLSERDKQFIEENQTGIVSECNCFASRHISEATLSVNYLYQFNYAYQFVNNGGNVAPVIRPCYVCEKRENESILVFYNTKFEELDKIDLMINVKGIDEEFLFKDLKCNILPIVYKNYEKSPLIYNFGAGKMKLLSIKSSLIDTYINIEWETYGAANKEAFFDENVIVFEWGKEENISLPMFLMPTTNKDKEKYCVVGEYNIGEQLPINEGISVYVQNIENDNMRIRMFEIN